MRIGESSVFLKSSLGGWFGRVVSSAVFAMTISGCGLIPAVDAVEVLPPRTNALCAAPGAASGALGRGLFDLKALDDYHGAYVADLRLSSYQDVVVDSIAIALQLPGDDAPGDFVDVPVGDLFLKGTGDDARSAIIENVVLLTRDQARDLDDRDYDVSKTEYENVVIHLEPRSDGGLLLAEAATFTLDFCDGCLLTEPAEEDCEFGVAENLVCRPGQDVPVYGCAQPSSSPF